jgi:hypothetical protein
LENGTRIPPGPIISYLETAIGVKRYQVVQKGYRDVLIRLTSRDASPQAEEALSRYLTGLLGDDVHINIETGSEESFQVKHRPVYTELP